MDKKAFDRIFYRGTDLWPQLIDKTIFITGNTGFYGSWFFDFLIELSALFNNKIYVFGGSRKNGFDIEQTYTFPNQLRKADYIINCAGNSQNADSAHYLGVANLLNLTSGKILHFSSGVVSYKTNTKYENVKTLGESLFHYTNQKYAIVRPFATVGPGMGLDKHFAISTFISQKLENKQLEVLDELIIRSFCYIEDLIIQCLYIMILGKGIYEVGSDDPISIRQAANLISDNVKIVKRDFKTNSNSNYYVADLFRIKKEFNLSLDYDSESAIINTLNYYVHNPTRV